MFATLRKLIGVGGKTKEKQAEEATNILATRFITFDEGCLLILRYLPHKPLRDYGAFSCNKNERARPIPEIQWDCSIVEAYRLCHLK